MKKFILPFTLLAVAATACSENDTDPRTGETLNPENDDAVVLGMTEDELADADFVDPSTADLDAAIALLQDGQYEQGVTAMNEFIAANPDNAEARWVLGNFFLRNYIGTKGQDVRDIEDAVKHLEKVVELEPDWGGNAYFQLAEAYFYWTNYEKAIQYMNEFKDRLDEKDFENIALAEERLLMYEKGLQYEAEHPETNESS